MLSQESKYGDLMQKSLPALIFWGTSHWNQCIFYILFFSEFFSPISWCYYPGLHKVQSYLPRKVWKKRRVKTPSKFIKLIYYYTNIVFNSYANLRSDRTIIHEDKSILLLNHSSGLILFIGIIMNWTWFEYKPDMVSFPVWAMLMVFLCKEIITESI